MDANQLSGTIPDSIASLKSAYVNMTDNLLTGDATAFVDIFGDEPFLYNCFDPSVPPSNPSC